MKLFILCFRVILLLTFLHTSFAANNSKTSREIYRNQKIDNDHAAYRLAQLLVKKSNTVNLNKDLFLKVQAGLNMSNRAIFDELLMESATDNRSSIIRKYDKIEKEFAKSLAIDFKKKIDMHTILVQINAEVYKEFYTNSELKSLYRFYKSPLGSKFLKVSKDMLLRTEQKNIEVLYPLALQVAQDAQDQLQSKVTSLFEDDL
ncbi:MAG: DUF2059 domain-containing protein [Candidatus Cloacimonetes bacterium]|nr:DUF2059 domain-containing protein [Candidatus Cloacimonadota bacterium]